MNKNTLIITSLIGLTLGFSSCKKTEEEPEDTTKPVIVINEPAMAMYVLDTTAGNTVVMPIDIDVSDNDELHEVSIEIIDETAGNTEVLHMHAHPDAATYNKDTTYTFNMMHMHHDMHITVEATDHAGNSSTKTHDFHIHML